MTYGIRVLSILVFSISSISPAFAIEQSAPVAAQGVSPPAPTTASAHPTIQLSKVILDTETKEFYSHLKVGTICVMTGKMNIVHQKHTEDFERFDHLVSDELKKDGFIVVSPSDGLFGDAANTPKADFMIGAVIQPISYDLCSSINGVKGTIKLSVQWSLFDSHAQKVVATAETQGEATTVKSVRGDGGNTVFGLAFTSSLANLVKTGTLQPFFGLPVPPPEVAAETALQTIPAAH